MQVFQEKYSRFSETFVKGSDLGSGGFWYELEGVPIFQE